MKKIVVALLLASSVTFVHAQCLVYNLVEKSMGSGSGTWTSKGYVLLAPLASPSDGLNHASLVRFYTYAGRNFKSYYAYEDFVSDDGSGYVSGGLFTALARIGNTYIVLAAKDASFGSDTISGVATYGPIAGTSTFGYYAKTLTGSSSTFNTAESDGTALGSTSKDYEFAYKSSSVNSYTLNTSLTKQVINMDFPTAEQFIKDTLRVLGYDGQ
jgi:hypothetical protein